MSSVSKREALQRQLAEIRRLLSMVSGHPVMAQELEERQKELEEEIAQIPDAAIEPEATLFFWGGPVTGSSGIDASFTARILQPFQNMVAADYSFRHRGRVGATGRRQAEKQSKMMLTALPRGSFGIRLSKGESDDLFEERELAETLSHIVKLVGSTLSEDGFEVELSEASPRVTGSLQKFLEVLSKGEAGLRLESGDLRRELSPAQALDAYIRVSGARSETKEVLLEGLFRGVLTHSGKFEFTTFSGQKITGKVMKDLTSDEIHTLSRDYLNKPCIGVFSRTFVHLQSGREHTSYILKGLAPIPDASLETEEPVKGARIAYHLVPSGSGWIIRKEGSSLTRDAGRTQKGAVERALKLLGDEAGIVYVHKSDGTLKSVTMKNPSKKQDEKLVDDGE